MPVTRCKSDGRNLPNGIYFFSYGRKTLASTMAPNGYCSPPLAPTRITSASMAGAFKEYFAKLIGTDHCPFFFDGTQPIVSRKTRNRHPRQRVGQCRFHENSKRLAQSKPYTDVFVDLWRQRGLYLAKIDLWHIHPQDPYERSSVYIRVKGRSSRRGCGYRHLGSGEASTLRA